MIFFCCKRSIPSSRSLTSVRSFFSSALICRSIILFACTSGLLGPSAEVLLAQFPILGKGLGIFFPSLRF
ncbi:uncharacterized protein EV154DRAFT_509764 [Mucor mucedo]|uniref:uncharacterized protein n=1 Tax=Mucor mucedo TaxID=29922 RepID=UPI00221FCBA0|nr:uncharacterized protein EV154DRAFT_509764 [Mucor mucedo]KAI7891025.1 hypothetical protein EV154DRAFT_509764 [Mucor mucedo]